MPIYVYKFIDSGETIEVQQPFSEETLTEYAHPETGEMRSVKKVFQPVGVTFKGSGFFKNDNRGVSSTTTSGSSDSSSNGSSDSKSDSSNSSDSKSDSSKSGDSKSSGSSSSGSSDTKAAKKSETKTASSSSSSSSD